jgi:hypothetical protein
MFRHLPSFITAIKFVYPKLTLTSEHGFKQRASTYFVHYDLANTCHTKAKAVALHSKEGERCYSSNSSSISALDGGECSASSPGRTLDPRKEPPVPILQEAVWAPRAGLDTEVRRKTSCFCRGSNLDSPFVQSVARHCTDGATRLLIEQ